MCFIGKSVPDAFDGVLIRPEIRSQILTLVAALDKEATAVGKVVDHSLEVVTEYVGKARACGVQRQTPWVSLTSSLSLSVCLSVEFMLYGHGSFEYACVVGESEL